MINVKTQGGAVGNGIANDQPALQTLIDAANNGGDGTFYFPPGRYRIDTTLTFPHKSGYHLIGCGLAPPLPPGNAGIGAESVIIWGGPDGGTMIKYHGVGLVWSGLGLWGCALGGSSSSCPPARAQHGIQLNKPSSSQPGTGKAWFDSILFAHCREAIATTATLNNDTLGFGYCWLEECDVGLHLTYEQSLQFTFQHVYARDVGTIFKVTDGGRIVTQCVAVASDDTIVLDLLGGARNSGYHQLGGVVINEDATNTTLLRNNTAAGSQGDQVVRFTDGHFRNAASVSVDRTPGGKTTLELVGCRGLAGLQGSALLRGSATDARIVFFVRDCDLSDLASSDISSLIATSSNNYRAWGRDNWTFAAGKVADSDDFIPNP